MTGGKKKVGRIVLAAVDGAVTVEKLAKRDGHYWLDPKSQGNGFAPIRMTESTEIWGVVAGVALRYTAE
ncbi:LexA family protein [Brucella pseudogrignonensis]